MSNYANNGISSVAASNHSDHSGASGHGDFEGGRSAKKICRDFERGSCHRVKCKYEHTKGVTFCREFQRNGCRRFECRFLHGSPEEEKEYETTGILSPRLQSELEWNSRPPVCKKFLNDCCDIKLCKYRHINRTQYLNEMRQDQQHKFKSKSFGNGTQWEPETVEYPISNKRRYPDDDEQNPNESSQNFPYDHSRISYTNASTKEYFTENQNLSTTDMIAQMNSKIQVLEEENRLNAIQLTDLRKKNTELLATNEFLLEQNAQLRMLTNSGGKAISEPITTPNQIVRTLTSVPVSLTTVSTGNQVSIANVSIAQPVTAVSFSDQNIIMHSQQIIAQANSQRSSQAQLAAALGPPQSLTVAQAPPPPPNPMRIAVSQSLVSYPIMAPTVIGATMAAPPPPTPPSQSR